MFQENGVKKLRRIMLHDNLSIKIYYSQMFQSLKET